MGQQEVYEFLSANPAKWFTSKQIAHALGISIGSVTMNLRKLRKSNAIAVREGQIRNTFLYAFDFSVANV